MTIINKVAFAGTLLAAGATNLYINHSHSASNLPYVYHGTTSDRMPDIQEGKVLTVSKHFFFTEEENTAVKYAKGEGSSAYRTGQGNNGTPLVIAVSPLDPSKTVWKKGLFGFHPYFPDGTQIKIEKITTFPECSAAEKHAKDLAKWC